MSTPPLDIALAPGAEENGLAVMLTDLVRQNLETNPHKRADFDGLRGVVAIVADDADVALTLCFDPTHEGGAMRVHSGVLGVPDVVIHATSDTILALSNMPLTRGLPIPSRGDEEGQKLVKSVFRAMKDGSFKVDGMVRHLPLMMRLTRVMSVNG